MRTPFIAGNWKMFKTGAEALAFVKGLGPDVLGSTDPEVVLCPPATAIATLASRTQAITGAASRTPMANIAPPSRRSAFAPDSRAKGTPTGSASVLSASAESREVCRSKLSISVSTSTRVNAPSTGNCEWSVGSRIAAPLRPIWMDITSPAVSAAPMKSAAPNPIANPMMVSDRNAVAVMAGTP